MNEWLPAGPAIPTADGERRPIATPNGGVLLVHLPDGWVAIADRCTHAGCPFSSDGEVDGERMICDCHGAEFDLRTGAVLRGPAELPVSTFPIRVVDDRLEVAMTPAGS